MPGLSARRTTGCPLYGHRPKPYSFNLAYNSAANTEPVCGIAMIKQTAIDHVFLQAAGCRILVCFLLKRLGKEAFLSYGRRNP